MFAVIRNDGEKDWWHLGMGCGYISGEQGKDQAKTYDSYESAEKTRDVLNKKIKDGYSDHEIVTIED